MVKGRLGGSRRMVMRTVVAGASDIRSPIRSPRRRPGTVLMSARNT
jgi:hypothetical protein